MKKKTGSWEDSSHNSLYKRKNFYSQILFVHAQAFVFWIMSSICHAWFVSCKSLKATMKNIPKKSNEWGSPHLISTAAQQQPQVSKVGFDTMKFLQIITVSGYHQIKGEIQHWPYAHILFCGTQTVHFRKGLQMSYCFWLLHIYTDKLKVHQS